MNQLRINLDWEFAQVFRTGIGLLLWTAPRQELMNYRSVDFRQPQISEQQQVSCEKLFARPHW
jgi:hypothetical protein